MFNIGDLVVYGNVGVCTVESIGPSTLSVADKERDYYSLVPYYSAGSKILTPCDNDKVVIRAIISREEAELLISEMLNISMLEICDEKSREQIYKDTIKNCNCREIIGLIKTIYERKQSRLAQGKKITSSDEKYFNLAEDKLYGELAVVLGIDKKQVKEYIREKVEG